MQAIDISKMKASSMKALNEWAKKNTDCKAFTEENILSVVKDVDQATNHNIVVEYMVTIKDNEGVHVVDVIENINQDGWCIQMDQTYRQKTTT